MKSFRYILASLMLFGVMCAPGFALAQEDDQPGGGGSAGGPTEPAEEKPETPKFDNPLGDGIGSISDFIFAIVRAVVRIGFYIVILAIIWSGFLFVKAQGNPEGLKKAKEAFLYTVIGAAILLGAEILANVVDGTINQLK